MKAIGIFFLFFLILVSCNQANKADIHGTWTSLDIIDNTGLDIKDRIEFNKDGTYISAMISKKDSILSQTNGVYSIENGNQTLKIITNGMTFNHTIISIKKDILKLKNIDGQLMRMERIE
ncbi:MAG: hypothetical protein JEZ01_19875 [Labilibaculum sp.]|nr:hypothetical protein [Labilibaculum sp.]MBI9060035.1 hypothetical protein [Labilibaculum sp.]